MKEAEVVERPTIDDLTLARRGVERSVALMLANMPESDLLRPEIPDHYPQLIAQLLDHKERGVSIFHGGPLDFRKNGNFNPSWLVPVEVKDAEGLTNFHVLYINCRPERVTRVPVSISFADTLLLKMKNSVDPSVQSLRGLIKSPKQPHIIVRPALTGSLYYPLIVDRGNIPSSTQLVSRINKLASVMGFSIDTIDMSDTSVFLERSRLPPMTCFDGFELSAPEVMDSEVGSFYVYTVLAQSDPWKYYEIYSSKPLEQFDRTKPIMLRIDSGCDIGQMYEDTGCDCHDQLLSALGKIKEDESRDAFGGGLVFHMPTHDNRGYGLNTKMETEGIKNGVPVVFNLDDLTPLDTLEAAKKVFGAQWDARTFDGAGSILAKLGFQDIASITDNERKMSHLRLSGLTVKKINTGTKGNGFNDHHLVAKHNDDMYGASAGELVFSR